MILKRVCRRDTDNTRKEYVNSGFNSYELYPNENGKVEISACHNKDLLFTIVFDIEIKDHQDYSLRQVFIMNDKGETIERIM